MAEIISNVHGMAATVCLAETGLPWRRGMVHPSEQIMFSPELLDHFQNPRHAGELEAPAARVRVENPVCGDILELSVNIADGRISEIRFRARGCTASIACGSAVAQLLEGRTPAELRAIDAARVEAEVGGLGEASKHAARLASDGVKALETEIRSQLRPGG